jgi:hypothetical protein
MVLRNVGILPQHYTASQTEDFNLKVTGVVLQCSRSPCSEFWFLDDGMEDVDK